MNGGQYGGDSYSDSTKVFAVLLMAGHVKIRATFKYRFYFENQRTFSRLLYLFFLKKCFLIDLLFAGIPVVL